MKTSDRLIAGQVYTRNELIEMFGIKDATVKNGIFRPKGHDSVWLFVTEEKTADRTQYHDRLNGDDLRFEGQTKERTDNLLIDSDDLGLELLLFHRKDRLFLRIRRRVEKRTSALGRGVVECGMLSSPCSERAGSIPTFSLKVRRTCSHSSGTSACAPDCNNLTAITA